MKFLETEYDSEGPVDWSDPTWYWVDDRSLVIRLEDTVSGDVLELRQFKAH